MMSLVKAVRQRGSSPKLPVFKSGRAPSAFPAGIAQSAPSPPVGLSAQVAAIDGWLAPGYPIQVGSSSGLQKRQPMADHGTHHRALVGGHTARDVQGHRARVHRPGPAAQLRGRHFPGGHDCRGVRCPDSASAHDGRPGDVADQAASPSGPTVGALTVATPAKRLPSDRQRVSPSTRALAFCVNGCDAPKISSSVS